MNTSIWMKTLTSLAAAALVSLVALPVATAGETGSASSQTKKMTADGPTTVTGEVVDLMCYLDHGARGQKHAACAKKCISSGGPVGLLTPSGEIYLVIGDHEPINNRLAPLAAKTVTMRGKLVSRNGMKMLENAELESVVEKG